ncbi:MAG: hypothetical protein V4443_05015 [Pseudomonadota bacterium]
MGNWQRSLCTGCIALSLTSLQTASASPQNGIGAYAGVISATEAGSASTGLSAGVDAQFVINDRWSLSPYLLISAERNSASTSVADGLAGVHVKRWFGDWFAGAQIFEHDRVIYGNGNAQSSAYGLGMGLLAGFEYASGWGAQVQADLLESSNISSSQRNAVRLHLVYRWH